MRPHSRNLRLNRLSDTPATFFITKSLRPKKAVLNKAARAIIVSAFAFAVQQHRIYLRAFVVMPDHWHALFALRDPWMLPEFMHALMSYVAGKTAGLLKDHDTSWQDGYYDTRVKTSKQFEFVSRYIEQNPVARALVKTFEEWDATSAKQKLRHWKSTRHAIEFRHKTWFDDEVAERLTRHAVAVCMSDAPDWPM